MSENNYGIPVDPDSALAAVKSGTLKPTEEPGEVTDGPIVELFSISVKDDDGKVVYDSGGMFQPFGWNKHQSLAAVLENEGAELDDTQVELIGALGGDKNGKSIASLVSTYNSVQRANAKQAEYARISNLKKPMSEETKARKIESMVTFFATMNGVSLDAARKTLTEKGVI